MKSLINKAQKNVFNEKAPRCPLCYEWMAKKYVATRGLFVWACLYDRVCIRVDDPFVGNWEKALEKSMGKEGIACPRPSCDGKMRYFATMRGYMKAICPKKKCGAEMTVADAEPEANYTPTSPDEPGVVQ